MELQKWNQGSKELEPERLRLKCQDQGYQTVLTLVAHVFHVDWLWLASYVRPLKKPKHVPWLTSVCVKTNPTLFLKPPKLMPRVSCSFHLTLNTHKILFSFSQFSWLIFRLSWCYGYLNIKNSQAVCFSFSPHKIK